METPEKTITPRKAERIERRTERKAARETRRNGSSQNLQEGERVLVIGGGVAGLHSAAALAAEGFSPLVIERAGQTGGHVSGWDRLFPSQQHASEVLGATAEAMRGIDVVTGQEIVSVAPQDDAVRVVSASGETYDGVAAVVATGFDLFDARLKEEYGYGLYENVITSAELEAMFRRPEGVLTAAGQRPRKVAFLHCVGSRDEKVGQKHCSKVCCITGVKQALELREAMPDCIVTNFYMDLRTFGNGYEELYLRSQQEGVNYIRGRISEAGETQEKQIKLKVEDTLAGRPLHLTVDMLVLLVGMSAPRGYETFGLERQANGFFASRDPFLGLLHSSMPRVYIAGTAGGPKTIGESVNEARAVAQQIAADVR